MSAPIVITVPTKFIPINVASVAFKKEPLSLIGSDGEESASSMDEFLIRGRKRRLDHLTWEEKLQRKKLKNRVAAQTSRDRKKAKMEEMERTIQQQADQLNELRSKCDVLQEEKDDIYNKYLNLESRFEELQRRIDEQQQATSTTTAQVKSEFNDSTTSPSVGSASTPLIGSAASAPFPLQQGSYMEAQTTLRQELRKSNTTDSKTAALWKIIALCLLYRTYSKSSMCPNWKSSPKAYWPTSQASWKTLIEEAARKMPKALAPASECLDQWWGPHQNSWNPAKIQHLIKEAV